jgi:hypothetical protein
MRCIGSDVAQGGSIENMDTTGFTRHPTGRYSFAYHNQSDWAINILGAALLTSVGIVIIGMKSAWIALGETLLVRAG